MARRPTSLDRRPEAASIAVGLLVVVAVAVSIAALGQPSPSVAASAVARAGGVAREPTAARTDPVSTDPSTDPSPASLPNDPPVSPTPGPRPRAADRFPGGLLIADRGNGRLLVVDSAGKIVWRFPAAGSLPRGQRFSADDAFVSPDGKTIVANDEAHQVIDRIAIATRRVVWQYGHYDRAGGGRGFLHTPDDAYPLANGNIVVADIRNCRILEIAPSKAIARQWGRTGRCTHHPPTSFAEPNGDTPLPDGGLLITEITGSRIVRLDAAGRVVFDIHAPTRYPSDAQLDAQGNIIVVDYANPGAVLRLSPKGRVLWRYGPRLGRGRLDHPSLAVPLPDGTIAVNDDDRARVVVIDPRTNRIVWQYGRTDAPSRADGHLDIPDGIDVVRPGIFLPAAP